jgi:hypothetical protein
MQQPTIKTPVPKCVNLARFAETMFSKFAQNQTLASLASTLATARQSLSAAQHAYIEAVSEIVHARAEVRWADYAADKAVRSTLRKAEDADGHKNGKIVSAVFPDGMTPIIKSVGSTQIKAMQELENRLEAIAGHWDAALDERATLTKLRKEYEAALELRRAAGQKASNKKALRDAAREDFLDVYAEVAARVKAEFPRNRQMQDLFFDTVLDAASSSEESDEEDTGEGHAGAPEEASQPS